MLAYVTLGSNDTPKALAFYDALMPELGAKRLFDNDRLYFYGTGPGAPMLAIGGPYDEKEATCGNGVMPALTAPDRETVDKVYAKAIEHGDLPVDIAQARACPRRRAAPSASS
ncbi:MAG: VOC family protein [Pseudomonadota bacterium]